MSASGPLFRFLEGAVATRPRLETLPVPSQGDLTEWVHYLERYFGLMAVSASAPLRLLRGYPLWVACHATHGPVLLKYAPAVLGQERVHGLALGNGEEFTLTAGEDSLLSDLRVLFEPFALDGPITMRNVTRFILTPVSGLMRLTNGYQVMATLASSLLFMANFVVLAYVVPTQNHGAFWAVAWLIMGIVVTVGLTQWLTQRAQFCLDSVTEERCEVLKLSLLWSMRPQYIATHGAHRVQEMCGVVAEAGKAMSEILMAAIASLAILPVLLLMYLRLPGYLFWATLAIGIIGTAPRILSLLRHHRLQRQLALSESETADGLYRIMGNLMRLNFYGATDWALSRWERRERTNSEARRSLASSASLNRESESGLMDITQLLAVFALSLLIAFSIRKGEDITVGIAFIMIHLVTQTYQMIPRVATAITKFLTIRADLNQATDLLSEAEHISELSKPTVTQAVTSIETHRLRLPHGCRFHGEESLTLRIEGPRVICIAGDSGAGKTTFLNCLLGLQTPEAGSIEVFGVDPMSLSSPERRRIFAYADQNIQLIPGTIRDNIKLFSTQSVSDRNLWEALERVMLMDRIRKLPLGLDTPIADARRNLSTGERQRMALAQCIAKQSKILVLDEAMSGLPADVEKTIFENIRPLFNQVYFVSHRAHMSCFAETVINLEARR